MTSDAEVWKYQTFFQIIPPVVGGAVATTGHHVATPLLRKKTISN